MKLYPINQVGGSCIGRLYVKYNDIIRIVGKPNVTDLDDSDKVKASWGYKTHRGKEIFIWAYKIYNIKENRSWSIDGDMDTFRKLFGNEAVHCYE